MDPKLPIEGTGVPPTESAIVSEPEKVQALTPEEAKEKMIAEAEYRKKEGEEHLLDELQREVLKLDRELGPENEDMNRLRNILSQFSDGTLLPQNSRRFSEAMEVSDQANQLFSGAQSLGELVGQFRLSLQESSLTEDGMRRAKEIQQGLQELASLGQSTAESLQEFASRTYRWAEEHGDLLGYQAEEVSANARILNTLAMEMPDMLRLRAGQWDNHLQEWMDIQQLVSQIDALKQTK